MTKNSSALGLEGSQYKMPDQVAGAVKKVAHHVKTAPSGVIDGVVRNPASKHLGRTYTKVVQKSQTSSGANGLHSKTHRSYTLMRNSVPKPAPVAKRPNTNLTPKHFFDQSRESRARHMAKSTLIQKFARNANRSEPTPKRTTKEPAKASVNLKSTKLEGSSTTVMPSMVTSASSHHLERLLDEALFKANSHKQSFKKKPRTTSGGKARLTSLSAAVLAVLLLVGFFAWQNIPQISMRMAAARAKIPAAIPSYTPSGFSFSGPINYTNGTVSIQFKARGDNSRTFVLIQQKSTWDSETLAANAIPSGTSVQTSQVRGNKIYIYGAKNDATWVNRGVRFTIKDLANLNSDQIVRIADSL